VLECIADILRWDKIIGTATERVKGISEVWEHNAANAPIYLGTLLTGNMKKDLALEAGE
jgi:hypothetical protein